MKIFVLNAAKRPGLYASWKTAKRMEPGGGKKGFPYGSAFPLKESPTGKTFFRLERKKRDGGKAAF